MAVDNEQKPASQCAACHTVGDDWPRCRACGTLHSPHYLRRVALFAALLAVGGTTSLGVSLGGVAIREGDRDERLSADLQRTAEEQARLRRLQREIAGLETDTKQRKAIARDLTKQEPSFRKDLEVAQARQATMVAERDRLQAIVDQGYAEPGSDL